MDNSLKNLTRSSGDTDVRDIAVLRQSIVRRSRPATEPGARDRRADLSLEDLGQVRPYRGRRQEQQPRIPHHHQLQGQRRHIVRLQAQDNCS